MIPNRGDGASPVPLSRRPEGIETFHVEGTLDGRTGLRPVGRSVGDRQQTAHRTGRARDGR